MSNITPASISRQLLSLAMGAVELTSRLYVLFWGLIDTVCALLKCECMWTLQHNVPGDICTDVVP